MIMLYVMHIASKKMFLFLDSWKGRFSLEWRDLGTKIMKLFRNKEYLLKLSKINISFLRLNINYNWCRLIKILHIALCGLIKILQIAIYLTEDTFADKNTFLTILVWFTQIWAENVTLTSFMTVASFYTPWQHHKTRDYLVLPGGLERHHLHEMGENFSLESFK